ncbi:DUF3604 domain-containing protein [Tropicimonas marinistellae]|uniref:DUF3604 domain-containing protein n=1 Tax=Tropicimonas marinistellae TaxID=1739787 RepID=UPI00137246F2
MRPLDFLVVADHAETLGVPRPLAEGDARLLDNEYGRRFHDLIQEGMATPPMTSGAAQIWRSPVFLPDPTGLAIVACLARCRGALRVGTASAAYRGPAGQKR